jgi:ubiquinone/menaquinone biosynthesis C-methylase UbiE
MLLDQRKWAGMSLVFGVLSMTMVPASLSAQEKSVKPGINDQFRKPDVAKFVERFEGESREVFDKREKVMEALAIRPGMAVADVGAGTGLYTRLFARAVGEKGRVLAVDIASEFLDHINKTAKDQKLGNIITVLGKDVSTELPPASVDLVYVCDTYHHFEYPARVLESIHKGLKDGGRLVVIDFIREPGVSSDWVMGHVRAGQAIVEKEITQAGFRKVDEKKGLMKENYLLVFEKASNLDNSGK